jgi:hypothetical protein
MSQDPSFSFENASELSLPKLPVILMLLVWIVAAIGTVLPFALGISPLDALLLRVPNEGNWWHVLVGLPFFLSLPMIWLRVHILNSVQLAGVNIRRILWTGIIVSASGTLLVETPFLLHRAGTSELQRLEVIFLGIGIILIAGILLFAKRKRMHPTKALIIGLTCAYLANAFLCLIVYGETKFEGQPRSGWYITLIVVLALSVELIWLLFRKLDIENPGL